MYKKSVLIVIIQLIGSFLGLLNIYFIAGNMKPEIYSLVGVFSILSTITMTFTDFGLETTLMREALYWQNTSESEKIRVYVTQAILSRILGFLILLPFLSVYIVYINFTKYSGKHLWLLALFLLGAESCSVNNALALIVKSQGGYVFSQTANVLNNYFIKFLGIAIYFWKGSYPYLIFYALSSIPLLMIYIVKLRSVICFKYVDIYATIKKVYKAKYLWLRTDLDYLKMNADSILVSTLFPPAVLGSYTIFKSLEQLSKNFIEGFFDILSQHMVKDKGNPEKLKAAEKSIKHIRNIIILLIFLGSALFMTNSQKWIRLIHLTKYDYMNTMIITVAIISVLHLWGKYEMNTVAFFASSKMNLKMAMVTFLLTCMSFIWVVLFSNIYGVLLQKITAYLVTSIIALAFFMKNREAMYNKILQ